MALPVRPDLFPELRIFFQAELIQIAHIEPVGKLFRTEFFQCAERAVRPNAFHAVNFRHLFAPGIVLMPVEMRCLRQLSGVLSGAASGSGVGCGSGETGFGTATGTGSAADGAGAGADIVAGTVFAAGAAGETAAFAAGPDGMPQIMLRYSSAVTRAGGGFCGRSPAGRRSGWGWVLPPRS